MKYIEYGEQPTKYEAVGILIGCGVLLGVLVIGHLI